METVKEKVRTAPAGLEALIRDQLKVHGSPLMLIQRSVLERQYNAFKRYLSKVEPFFAIKANPHPEIIKKFVEMGSGFDVASAKEIEWVLDAGADPEKVIFANTIKSDKDLQYACQRGIHWMTFDNESELFKIAKHCPGAKVLLRIKVANVGSQVELSLKFGADVDQAVFLLKKAENLGLRSAGISFHVGSQCTNVENYIQALIVSAGIFKDAEDSGLHLDTLDIGGGFPIRQFEQQEKPMLLEDMARVLRENMRKLFPKDTRFIAEPGRFFVGPAGTLATKVVGRTFRNNRNYYYLDDGVYQDFSGIVFDHCKYEFRTLKRGQKFLSTLAGPTCDSLDTISENEELPELDVGNVVYVKNIGAYSCASAVPAFNGFSPAKILVI